MNTPGSEICRRLRELRIRTFGPRGKAQFAKRLRIGPSTYQQYESSRVPPAEVLVRAAEATGCDLVWLLTGEGRPSTTAAATDDPLVDRVRELLSRRPETARGLSAFLMLIDPTGPPMGAAPPRRIVAPDAGPPAARAETPAIFREDMIPVVGSTAAGRARFWNEIFETWEGTEPGAEENAGLERLLAECHERYRSANGRLVRDPSDPRPDLTVALIQFSRPDEAGIVEFLSCPALADRPARLVAWRIDGSSMAPRYQDGDFVLASPDAPAVDGQPCVAHQRGQIGVNCKIFKRDGSDVLLIPVNEAYPPQRLAAGDLLWANRVLYRVRLAPRESTPPA